MFAKILIANRGEIACRITRTARRMGIATVAIYSDADRDAMHVSLADEARFIGPAPARQSYLDQQAVIRAALETGAEAIHPGYGFLSENADFAEACHAAGLVFIGPPVAAIRAMGGKSEAKALMERAGVPLVPGYHGLDQSPQLLATEAARISYPVLVKASAGGGGKGMRVVEREDDFTAALEGAKRESLASFGDDRMLIEKYLLRPRHVEVQVFADNHGNCVSLFERDCSIQRRHQKVIEEAPAPNLSYDLRRRMGEAAVAAAKAIGYSGAGTIEFLLDASGAFYFMEMNTRLQVEHPVTEFITGLDLVEWQLRIASGERLPREWQDLQINGHAIEARLYAEDAASGFLPSTGRIRQLVMPEPTPTIRIDSGIRPGDTIGVHYDPMIAKLIVWGEDRPTAVRRLQAALAKVAITGLVSNADFLGRLSRLPDFTDAHLDTGLIGRNEEALLAGASADQDMIVAAATGVLLARARAANASADPHSPWAAASCFRLNGPAREMLRFTIAGQEAEIPVTHHGQGYEMQVDGTLIRADGSLKDDGRLILLTDNGRRSGYLFPDGNGHDLFLEGRYYRVDIPDPLDTEHAAASAGGMTAPMPGIVRSVLSAAGQHVEAGTALLVMEAMKMEHTIRAPSRGIIKAINFPEGTMVEAGAVLIEFEAEDK